MNTDFLITGISRVILVDKNEYKEKITEFKKPLSNNELIFHFSGEATVYFDDEILETKKNTIRFLPKENTKRYIVDRKKPGECILICFDSDVPVHHCAFTVDVTNAATVGNLFRKLFTVWLSRQDGYYFECISILYKIFAELQKSNYIPQKQYEKIKPAVEFIENNFTAGKISVEFLSELCGISTSYLKKLFVKRFRTPPSGYITQLKMNYAGDLLRSGLYSVTEISEACGFDSIYYFSRQFRKHTGLTPTEFKTRYKSSK